MISVATTPLLFSLGAGGGSAFHDANTVALWLLGPASSNSMFMSASSGRIGQCRFCIVDCRSSYVYQGRLLTGLRRCCAWSRKGCSQCCFCVGPKILGVFLEKVGGSRLLKSETGRGAKRSKSTKLAMDAFQTTESDVPCIQKEC